MPRISQHRVRLHLEAFGDSTTNAEKGTALEDLICYLIGLVPGVEIYRRNVLNAFQTEEIDVAFWNERIQSGLHFLPNILLVECKNWNHPVGSQEVAYFTNRLRNRHCEYGILVARQGITGDPGDLTRAHYELAMALADGIHIIIVTANEIEGLQSTEQLVQLIKGKICELKVSGAVFLNPGIGDTRD